MSKSVVMAGWDDVPHLSEEAKAEMLEATPPHLRNSRSKGIPGLGAGAVYSVAENEITYDVSSLQIPTWYRRAYAMDVGWNATAVVFGAFDTEQDTWYIYDGFKRGKCEPEIHASAIRKRYPGGMKLMGAIDPAAKGRSQIDGKNLLKMYCKDEGLRLVPADNAVESGIQEVWSRLSTGRLKIASHLVAWFDEYRIYSRREDGKIKKEHDHYMDATRYLITTGASIAKPLQTEKIVNADGRRYF